MSKTVKLTIGLLTASASLVATGCSYLEPAVPQATVTQTVTATPEASNSHSITSSPSYAGIQSASAPASETSVASPTEVNAAKFQGTWPGTHYFSSPSGNLLCGILQEDAGYRAGCQAQSLVRNLPECDDPMVTWGPEIALLSDGTVGAGCTSEGIFVDSDTNTLEYGQQLTVGTISCASWETGVTCHDSATGAAFRASKNNFVSVP